MSAAAVDATLTARDQRSWVILWQMIGEDPPGPMPEGRMAVAVFQAADRGPARKLEFNEIVAGETALVIGYRSRLAAELTQSGPENGQSSEEDISGGGTDTGDVGDARTNDLTAPYIVRLLPLSRLPVYYVGTVQQQTNTQD